MGESLNPAPDAGQKVPAAPALRTDDGGARPTSLLGTRLRWFLAEFLVVVAGVWVAMGLSGLVDKRRDLQREQVYLQQLSADLGTSERN